MNKRLTTEIEKEKSVVIHHGDKEIMTEMDMAAIAELEQETETLKETTKHLEDKVENLNSTLEI